ncbi:uncharacterized protein EV422DRAFT_569344 [Fimicolochytrium jonesii]|uniref:uncharacterized protein n=1 Tax=Fimicolochytrium jonesii TaxID=1396493 RepID=UPI0022FE9800|nr:uncharacterized protein EV422DRAFT_569344 [Fimicolochytrium jonesii]KAI8818676.1 hypothetical protein EV422DRAFT_569344 [Fimicolochytrium jonesii]
MSLPPSQQEILEGAGQLSIATFVSTLAFTSGTALGFYCAFFFLRSRAPLVYSPRSAVVPEEKRAPQSSGYTLLKSCLWVPEEELIRQCGQDAFAVIYYMRQMLIFFATLGGVAIVTLFPLHQTGGQNLLGLDSLTLANIGPAETKRLWAHLLISWIYGVSCMRVIRRLLQKATSLRHSFLLSEENRRSLDGYTLLIRDIPKHLRDPHKLFILMDRIQPGCVEDVVVSTPSRRLDRYASQKISVRNAIESEITAYLRNAAYRKPAKRRRSVSPVGSRLRFKKATREMEEVDNSGDLRGRTQFTLPHPATSSSMNFHGKREDTTHSPSGEIGAGTARRDFSADTNHGMDVDPSDKGHLELPNVEIDVEDGQHHFVDHVLSGNFQTSAHIPMSHDTMAGDGGSQDNVGPSTSSLNLPEPTPLAPKTAKRPIHRSYYFVGHQSDAIADNLIQLRKLIEKTERKRTKIVSNPTRQQGAAFIVFKDIFSPHVAALVNLDPRPSLMADRQTCVNPDDIIWENLDMEYGMRKARTMVATACIVGLTLAWASMMTVISSFATLDRAIQYLPFLKVFDDLDPATRGVVQGILPTLAVSLLFMLVPFIVRRLSHFAGHPTQSSIERTLLTFYHGFLVFNILLVITISGSLVTALKNIIDNPQRILSILATSIPTVSNFYVNYVMLLALNGPAGEVLQLSNLLLKPIMLRLFGSTPRSILGYSRPGFFLPGTTLASHSLIATIGLTYCTVAPLIVVFVVLYFGLYQVAYSYQMRYVYQHLAQTGGLYLNTLARQLFVGLYIHQLVLIGLFLLKKAYPQALIMLIMLNVTFLYHKHTRLYTTLMMAVPARAVVQMEAKLGATASSRSRTATATTTDHSDADAARRMSGWDKESSSDILDAAQAILMEKSRPIWDKTVALVGGIPTLIPTLGRNNPKDHADAADVEAGTKVPTDVVKTPRAPPADMFEPREEAHPPGKEVASDIPQASASGHPGHDFDDSDSDDEDSTADSNDPVGSHAEMPAANIKRKYLGPADYRERLSPPSARLAPCMIWVPHDMYEIANTAIAAEINEALGSKVRFVCDWAKLDSKGHIVVDLELACDHIRVET